MTTVRTSNPAIRAFTPERLRDVAVDRAATGTMTAHGTINRMLFLVLLLVASGTWAWLHVLANPGSAGGLILGCALTALVVAIVTIFRPQTAPLTAPVYALLEGVVLGGVSSMYQAQYAGLPLQAAAITVLILLAMLILWRTGIIKVTQNFRLGVTAATGAIAIYYIISLIAAPFGVTMPLLVTSSWMSIAFSFVVVIVASLNFALDFDMIARGVEARAPKHMEWFGAFATLITLCWLYLEILRLLSKMRK